MFVARGASFPLALACALAIGCTASEPPAQPAGRPFEGQQLQLLVVDDPALAAAAERIRGEWRARTGADFEVQQVSAADAFRNNGLSFDAVLYPSHWLGPLAEQKRIAPIPKDVLADGQLQWQDVFELLRTREAAWGGTTYALPFGSPTLVCYYRADVLVQAGASPPQTWADYQRLVELLRNRTIDGVAVEAGTLEPLAPGWAGLTLLARAAAYAKHPDFYSVLFNLESMKPLIDTPPFVKALDELVAAAKGRSETQLQYTPEQVRAAFWRGECAMALTWPTAARTALETKADGASSRSLQMNFAALPGSREVYNPETLEWQPRSEVAGLPVLGSAGRLGSVAQNSTHSQAAIQLLISLCSLQWSTQVSGASSAATLFRESHLHSPRDWVEAAAPPAAAQAYGRLIQQTLSGQDAVLALNISGRDEYLAALDRAVHRALRGEATSAEALHECAAAWSEITTRLGVDQQRNAYRKSAVQQP